jgi:hypothetical protein
VKIARVLYVDYFVHISSPCEILTCTLMSRLIHLWIMAKCRGANDRSLDKNAASMVLLLEYLQFILNILEYL